MKLRELKKAKTKKLISDVATLAFLEKGYHSVTVAEIAQKAEVSVTTLFKYFPSKEALLFDSEDDREGALLAAITGRDKKPILTAIQEHLFKSPAITPTRLHESTAFMELVKSIPELRNYERSMWTRFETSLARCLQSEAQISKLEAECVASLLIHAFNQAKNAASPRMTLNALFDLLRKGWEKGSKS